MNQRIEAFWKESFGEDPIYPGSVEKFAELIVNECVSLVADQNDKVDTNWECDDGVHIGWKILEHFGVEQ